MEAAQPGSEEQAEAASTPCAWLGALLLGLGTADCCRVYGRFCFVVICTCVWSLLPAGKSQESSSRAIILSGFGHLSPSRGYLSGASGPFSHQGCYSSLLTGVPASASAQPSTLRAAASEMCQIVSSFVQNLSVAPE